MARGNVYSVYDGDQIIIEKATSGEIAKRLGVRRQLVTINAAEGYLIRGKLKVVRVYENDEEDDDTPKYHWSKKECDEWDRVCSLFQKNIRNVLGKA